jgi:hypothetical protein
VQKTVHEGQIKRWVDRCGSVEQCLWEIAKLLLKLVEEQNLTEIVLDCLRIHKGELEYGFDSWMKPTHLIVTENQH